MVIIQLIGTPLYQWDSDRSIEVFPQDPSCSIDEVHACSVGGAGAYNLVTVRADYKVTCEIPNILLQAPAGIRVFGIMRTSSGCRTIIERTFCVTPRPKPDDYVYTETEVRSYINLEERIEALEKGSGPGKDGGYYIPSVSQVDENTMNVSFAASKEGMAGVPDQEITLPSGKAGVDGKPGADGATPHIGDNGNWFIGDIDTGVPSRGKDAPNEAVLYKPQTLTEEQKTQARDNIGACDKDYVDDAIANLDRPTGGEGGHNAFLYEFTLEEDLGVVNLAFPANWEKILQFNIHMEANIPTEMEVTSFTGGASWAGIGTLPAGSIGLNIYGITFDVTGHNTIICTEVSIAHRSDSALPKFPTKGRLAYKTGNTFALYSATEGAMFPAGTTFDVWGVYAS